MLEPRYSVTVKTDRSERPYTHPDVTADQAWNISRCVLAAFGFGLPPGLETAATLTEHLARQHSYRHADARFSVTVEAHTAALTALSRNAQSG